MAATGTYSGSEQKMLLGIARDAVVRGLRSGGPAALDPADYAEALRAAAASFVTLKIAGALRGCMGTLEAVRPLAGDVNENAYAAAFRDPRFPRVAERELAELQISISVLSSPQAMAFSSESDLLAQLRPGVEGLILQEGDLRGTFLPSVWESLPHPPAFLRQLKLKAGLPSDYWSDTLRVYCYRTEVIGDA